MGNTCSAFGARHRVGVVNPVRDACRYPTGTETIDTSRLTTDKLGSPLLAAAVKGPIAVVELARNGLRSCEQWGEPTTNPMQLGTRARALTAAVDVIIHPLLNVVDDKLGGRAERGGDGGDDDDERSGRKYSWQDVEVSDLRLMIMDAGTAQYTNYKELGRWSGAVDAVTALLARLHAVWGAAQQLDSAGTLASLFPSQALNRLVGMLAVIYCRRVTLEGASAAKRRTRQWCELCEAVGLLERHVAVALSPASKALMLMLYAAAGAGEKRLNIRVSRHMAFWDAHAEAVTHGVLASSRERACYKIFPSFVQSGGSNRGNGAAEHGEGHGPRKEFFLLAAASAAGVPLPPAGDDSTGEAQCNLPPGTKPLLVYNRAAGAYWLNQTLPQSDEAATQCRFLGWLMGQAVCNHCTLGVALPPMLFELLLHGPDKYRPSLAALRGFDPEMARAIDNTRQLPERDFQAMLELEGMAASTSRERYVQHAVDDALRGTVLWQLREMHVGLKLALDPSLLEGWAVTATDLAAMVGGADEAASDGPVAVREVFRVVLDDELAASAAPLADALWAVVDAWPPTLQRRFVRFVTGTDRLPLAGTELMRVELPFVAISTKDHQRHLQMLPQAHTCENILELPNYWESVVVAKGKRVDALSASVAAELRREMCKVLEERLRLAVTHCIDYGLDQMEALETPARSTAAPALVGAVDLRVSPHKSPYSAYSPREHPSLRMQGRSVKPEDNNGGYDGGGGGGGIASMLSMLPGGGGGSVISFMDRERTPSPPPATRELGAEDSVLSLGEDSMFNLGESYVASSEEAAARDRGGGDYLGSMAGMDELMSLSLGKNDDHLHTHTRAPAASLPPRAPAPASMRSSAPPLGYPARSSLQTESSLDDMLAELEL